MQGTIRIVPETEKNFGRIAPTHDEPSTCTDIVFPLTADWLKTTSDDIMKEMSSKIKQDVLIIVLLLYSPKCILMEELLFTRYRQMILLFCF